MKRIMFVMIFIFLAFSCNKEGKNAGAKQESTKKTEKKEGLKKEESKKDKNEQASKKVQEEKKVKKILRKDVKPKVAAIKKLKVEPVKAEDPVKVFNNLLKLAKDGKIEELKNGFTKASLRVVKNLRADDAKKIFQGKVGSKVINGGMAVLKLTGNPKIKNAVFYLEDGKWKFDIISTFRYREPNPGEKNPLNKPISIEEALKSVKGNGKDVYAKIVTEFGEINCKLLPDVAPVTVANFIGLASGLRAFKDPKTGKWVKKRFYDGLTFHRVIPNFMIQGGDPLGNGTGGPGYSFKDEFSLNYRFDKPGMLAMANSGPNTNGSQFFITEVPTPWLNDHHTIFGVCKEIDVIKKIAREGKNSKIKKIEFYRK